MDSVRPSRSFENFSRGVLLVRDIRRIWKLNRALPPGSNREIENNIQGLLTEFDLTIVEWHYWCEITSSSQG